MARVVDVQSANPGSTESFDDLGRMDEQRASHSSLNGREMGPRGYPRTSRPSFLRRQEEAMEGALLGTLENCVTALVNCEDGAQAVRLERVAQRVALLARGVTPRSPGYGAGVKFPVVGVAPADLNPHAGSERASFPGRDGALPPLKGGKKRLNYVVPMDLPDYKGGNELSEAPEAPEAKMATLTRSPTREQKRKIHRSELVARFVDLDADGDGEVTEDEFASAMEKDGLTVKEAKALFKSVDENGDGTMDQMEFISLMESKHPLLKKVTWAAELQAGFNDVDLDEDEIWVDPNSVPFLMVSPNSNFRMTWDITTAFLLIYVAIIEPLRLGFVLNPPKGSFIYVMDYWCDGFFVADFFLNFRTGYFRRDTGALDMDPKRSALAYLRSWAFLDFISSVPPVLDVFFSQGLTALRSAKILKLGRVMKLGKMLRLMKFMRFGKDTAMGEFIEDFFASSKSKALRRIFQVLLSFAILAHYLGCLFALAGMSHLRRYAPTTGRDSAHTWSIKAQYLASVYWAVTTMTTVGYGDMVPVTDAERAYTMFAMIIGGAFYGYVVAQATCIVKAYEAQKGPYYAKMDRVHSWLNYHQVPLQVRRHVRKYYRTYFSHRTAFDEREIVDDLDPESQQKIADHVLPSCIRHNELFEVLPKGALCKLVHVIRLLTFDVGDVVVSEGDKSSSMFVLYVGKVRVRRTDEFTDEVTEETLQPGGSFGERAVLGVNSRSYVTARAIAPSKLYIITQDSFMQAFLTLPEALLAMRLAVDGSSAPNPTTFSHLSPSTQKRIIHGKTRRAVSPTSELSSPGPSAKSPSPSGARDSPDE